MKSLFSHARDYPTWRYFWLVVLAALLARFVVGYTNDRFIHPDEMFQYYEPAHRLLYGYGIVTWEWLYGIRSWLIPLLIAGLMKVPNLVGLDGVEYYEFTVVLGLSALNTTMVIAMYRFAQMVTDELTARVAMVLGAIWPIFLYFGPTPLPNLMAGVGLMWIAVLVLRQPTTLSLVMLGVISALTLGVRYQVIPAVGLMHLFAMYTLRTRYFVVLFAGLATLAPIGYLDVIFWRGFFSSFLDNFYFNFTEKISEKFGQEPVSWYFTTYVADTGALIIPMLIGCFLIMKRAWPIWLSIAIGVIFMHVPAHKEFRFIVWMLPFGLIGLAYLMVYIEPRFAPKPLVQGFFAFWVSVFTVIFLAFQYEAFEPLPHRKETISIVREIRSDPDLRGIHIDAAYRWWDRWGGYYYLNRPVPYYYKDVNHDEILLVGDYDESSVSHIVTDYPEPPSDDAELIMQTATFWVWKRTNIPEPWGDKPYNMVYIQRLGIKAEPLGPRYPLISDGFGPASE
ncbi:MAG: hypothetical protein AAGP08_02445 [Pseudomonadota bacterium]